jgi:hypothetical protein
MTLRTRVERALTASCSAALAVKGNLGGVGETIGETPRGRTLRSAKSVWAARAVFACGLVSGTAMRAVQRYRHYVSPAALAVMRPLLRYSEWRAAYVLRLVGSHVGPVLRRDRRVGRSPYPGVDRRQAVIQR